MSVEFTRKIDGLAFEINSQGFHLHSDVSEASGGKGSAPNPHDYLEIALASCTAITVQMYANHKKIPLEYSDVKVKITKEEVQNEISREIRFVGNLTEEQKKRLFEIAEKCPVHKFLSKGTKIVSRLV